MRAFLAAGEPGAREPGEPNAVLPGELGLLCPPPKRLPLLWVLLCAADMRVGVLVRSAEGVTEGRRALPLLTRCRVGV